MKSRPFPTCFNALELTGTVVTIDAMGCQRGIARQIIGEEADYVLAVRIRVFWPNR